MDEINIEEMLEAYIAATDARESSSIVAVVSVSDNTEEVDAIRVVVGFATDASASIVPDVATTTLRLGRQNFLPGL